MARGSETNLQVNDFIFYYTHSEQSEEGNFFLHNDDLVVLNGEEPQWHWNISQMLREENSQACCPVNNTLLVELFSVVTLPISRAKLLEKIYFL